MTTREPFDGTDPPFPEERSWSRRRGRRGGSSGGGAGGGRTWLRRLAIGLVGAAGLAVLGLAALWLTLPDPRPLAGDWPDSTAYMELRQEQARDDGRRLELRWEPVPLGRIPEHVQRAVRVSEDAMFYQHDGVDWHEVRASLREWWSDDESLRGASTISMQLARNLYLSPERSFLRKARETLLALRLEDRLPKERILELYLSVVELGPGVFGVEAASRHYWGLPVAALDRRRAAELAATLPSPLEDNPRTRTRSFLWRARLIERRAFRGDTTRMAPFAADTPGTAGDTVGAAGPDRPRRGLPSPDTAGSVTAPGDPRGRP